MKIYVLVKFYRDTKCVFDNYPLLPKLLVVATTILSEQGSVKLWSKAVSEFMKKLYIVDLIINYKNILWPTPSRNIEMELAN